MEFSVFKKYPQGFGSLFATQACFNFSFYGLKSIFVLYSISQFSLPESEAISLFAILMALSYGTSLLGGWIADNCLGTKSTIILGGLLQAGGVSFLMLPNKDLYFFGLALISLGSGCFKPTLSTSVGMLFDDPRDHQKDKAYSTFYIAMNLGSFIAPLACGFVSKTYGGYYTSLLLIIATLIGGVVLFYEKTIFKQEKNLIMNKKSFVSHPLFMGMALLFLVFGVSFLFKYHESFTHLMGTIAIGSFVYLGRIFYQSNPQERKDVLKIILYILLFTLFCSLFEQAGSSLLLFFDKAVDRNILGMTIPASAFLSLDPIIILTFGPLFILFSEKIFKNNVDGLVKIGVGFLFVSLSFMVLALGCAQTSSLVSPLWVGSAIFLQTIAELLIVPIGFSNISKLAPPRFRSIMMSFWLMAIAYGHYFGGFIAQFSLKDLWVSGDSLEHYYAFFWNLAIMPSIVGLLLLVYSYIKCTRIFFKTQTERS
ncbi:MAG: peptide MFS transporter [Alphaproteobacteria bacterium]|nr:peptide MFS transporter [Alphaproteobacteria bacterium]